MTLENDLAAMVQAAVAAAVQPGIDALARIDATTAATAADVAVLKAHLGAAGPVPAAPVPAPIPTPAPVASPPPALTVPATPAVPATLKPVTLTVGPHGQFQRLSAAMSSVGDDLYNKIPLSLDVQMEVVADPAYYADDVSSHFYAAKSNTPMDWPPYEQTVPCDAAFRRAPGSLGLIELPVTPGALYYGKGAFIFGGMLPGCSRISLSGFRISGARRGDVDGNLAGVRLDGAPDANPVAGDFLIEDCEIFGCDDGILGGSAGQTLTLRRVHLHGCGSGSGRTHNLYAGPLDSLSLEDVLSEGALVGHLVKSRAARTILRRVRLFDGSDGTASYCLDLPNGGVLDADGLVIWKGAKSSNTPVIAYGEEGEGNGGQHPTGSMKLRNTIIVSDRPDALLLWNASAVPVDAAGLQTFGLPSTMRTGLFGATTDVPFPGAVELLTTRPVLDMASPVGLQG